MTKEVVYIITDNINILNELNHCLVESKNNEQITTNEKGHLLNYKGYNILLSKLVLNSGIDNFERYYLSIIDNYKFKLLLVNRKVYFKLQSSNKLIFLYEYYSIYAKHKIPDYIIKYEDFYSNYKLFDFEDIKINNDNKFCLTINLYIDNHKECLYEINQINNFYNKILLKLVFDLYLNYKYSILPQYNTLFKSVNAKRKEYNEIKSYIDSKLNLQRNYNSNPGINVEQQYCSSCKQTKCSSSCKLENEFLNVVGNYNKLFSELNQLEQEMVGITLEYIKR